jgi:hypothetical protein
MLSLCAVEPDGSRCIGDLVGECPVGNGLGVGGRDETGPEAASRQRRARRGKGSLRNRVVLGPEAERNSVTLGGADAVWLEDKITTPAANSNKMVLCESGASKGGSSEDVGEMHYDWFGVKETSSFR